ncbi:MAG: SecD/SecF family protein translocase subunit, partial [Oscillospiraceae bacterium]|nr:SecD/SecF family protein translocase subunit [Oscillospiraceae bacterium]
KRGKKPVFFIVAALILVFSYLAIFGVSYYTGDIRHTVIKGMAADTRWGIDIRGGVEATFKPAEDKDATEQEMDAAKAIIETRLISDGITDYELYVDYGTDRIIMRFPWKSDETVYDPLEAIKEISATAKLTFCGGTDSTNVLMEGKDVDDAYMNMAYDANGNVTSNYAVYLNLTAEGAATFADITSQYQGQTVSIWMDDEMLSAPTVNDVISDGKATISGDFTAEEATTLANQIKSGALPFTLETETNGTISPTLGANSLNAMAIAGIIAFVLVALFMIFAFRFSGVIAVIGLLGQVGFSFAVITMFFPVFNSFTMTLPGIAGIILSIGMGVDANIITAGRIEEELKAGRSLDAAIDRGTQNSLSAIVDGNVTVIIVALILLLVFGPANILSGIFGQSTTGTIYSFGYTLLMGVVANFIMGIAATRLMLKSIIRFKPMRKKWFFGGAKGE